jgi:hypothetical protein
VAALAGNFQPLTFLITTEAASRFLVNLPIPFIRIFTQITMVVAKTTNCTYRPVKTRISEVFPKRFSALSSNYRGYSFPSRMPILLRINF